MDIVIPGAKVVWFDFKGKPLILLDLGEVNVPLSNLHVGQKVTLMVEQRLRKAKELP